MCRPPGAAPVMAVYRTTALRHLPAAVQHTARLCAVAAAALIPYTHTFASPTNLPSCFGAEELWAVRYILMARAVWHGYNVW